MGVRRGYGASWVGRGSEERGWGKLGRERGGE